MRTLAFCGLTLGMLALTGCRSVSSTDWETPAHPVPDAWNSQLPEDELIAAQDLAVWWTQFEDETLTRLVQRSLDENLDLKNAAARVEEAFAIRGIAAGERVPQVSGSAGAFTTRLSDSEGGANGDRTFTAYSLGFDASWELDLWGRIRNSVDAADASARATIEDMRGVRALIAAQVTSGYITLRELQLRQALLIENITRQKDTLKLTQGRFDVGLVPQLDVNQAKVNLSRTEAALPQLVQQESEIIHALEILAGLAPGELASLLTAEAPVPLPAEENLQDLPANVLRRRPDLRAAEQRLFAAASNVGVARADLYPRVSLSGSFAWKASESGELFSGNSVSSNFGPGVYIPIFQGGRLRSQLDAAESRALQTELSYRQQVLEALGEVEDALTAYQQEKQRLEKLNEGVTAAEATVKQVRSLYENGLVTFLNVLDAERSLADQQDQAAASLGQGSRNLVSVYRAFGGGWDAPAFVAPEKVAAQVRTPLSEVEAEMFVSEKVDGMVTLKLESPLNFTRLNEASEGMLQEIKVDISGNEVLEGLLPGERVLISWTEVSVEEGEVIFSEIQVEAVERLSPRSP
jgi:outer membrane protein, multidrug efflux system